MIRMVKNIIISSRPFIRALGEAMYNASIILAVLQDACGQARIPCISQEG